MRERVAHSVVAQVTEEMGQTLPSASVSLNLALYELLASIGIRSIHV